MTIISIVSLTLHKVLKCSTTYVVVTEGDAIGLSTFESERPTAGVNKNLISFQLH
ncbi:MAG: hypothetical protein CM15mP112_08440 [Flavobacteriales bacterium]|nr:MAG: hypothetical protein CM15mP112_08440 [Flavobacteriales bacterium]